MGSSHDVCSFILDPKFSSSFASSLVVGSERSEKKNKERTRQNFLPALTFYQAGKPTRAGGNETEAQQARSTQKMHKIVFERHS